MLRQEMDALQDAPALVAALGKLLGESADLVFTELSAIRTIRLLELLSKPPKKATSYVLNLYFASAPKLVPLIAFVEDNAAQLPLLKTRLGEYLGKTETMIYGMAWRFSNI